jgi:hypothetical protein
MDYEFWLRLAKKGAGLPICLNCCGSHWPPKNRRCLNVCLFMINDMLKKSLVKFPPDELNYAHVSG